MFTAKENYIIGKKNGRQKIYVFTLCALSVFAVRNSVFVPRKIYRSEVEGGYA